MNILSLFSGCGGLDLGFERAGFDIPVANEFDPAIYETFKVNHPKTHLVEGDVRQITKENILPFVNGEIDGIIGGPPCQSWSEAGSLKGIEDARGQLFFDYIRLLQELRPKFFLAENVSGMLADRHSVAVQNILNLFEQSGYDVSLTLVNAKDYGVAEERKSQVERFLRSLPIRPISIVLGRYGAALCVYGIACAVLMVYPIVLAMVGLAIPVPSYTALIMLFLLGAALLAFCSFTSALTSSPVVAVLLGIGGVLLLHLPDALLAFTPVTGAFARLLPELSLFSRYSVTCSGVFEWSTVVFYLSFTVFFLALAWLVVGHKRRH